jgi:hypothetical protein
LNREQVVFNWGGKDYPQEPVHYRWGQHVEFVEGQLQSFLPKFFPLHYAAKDWVVFEVEPQSLDLFERGVNGEDVYLSGQGLDAVLKLLLHKCEDWIVIFEPHYDQIDEILELGPDECIKKLESVLRRTSPADRIRGLPSEERPIGMKEIAIGISPSILRFRSHCFTNSRVKKHLVTGLLV